jgi:putative phosphoesterase
MKQKLIRRRQPRSEPAAPTPSREASHDPGPWRVHTPWDPTGPTMHAIALVADTHGWLDDRLCPALAAAKVTHILHAGDVALGKKRVANRLDAKSLLQALSKVAPVNAVRGNTDDGTSLPAMCTYTAGAVRFIVHHGNKNDEAGLPDWKDDEAVLAALEPAGGWRDSGDIIVSGHSHKPRFVRHASGVAFLNPGTAGGPTETKRFGATLPQQCAVVHCSEGRGANTAFEVRAIDLNTGAARIWFAEGEQLPEAKGEKATNTVTGPAAPPATRKRMMQTSPTTATATSPALRTTARKARRTCQSGNLEST